MPLQNSGFSRRTKVIATTIINGSGNSITYPIYDYINEEYIAITQDDLLLLSVSEYNNRIEAFKMLLEISYPELTIDLTDYRYESLECSTGETISYNAEFISYECVVTEVNPPIPTPICSNLTQSVILDTSTLITIRYYLNISASTTTSKIFSIIHTNNNNTNNININVTILSGNTSTYFEYTYNKLNYSYTANAYLNVLPSGYTDCGAPLVYIISPSTTTTLNIPTTTEYVATTTLFGFTTTLNIPTTTEYVATTTLNQICLSLSQVVIDNPNSMLIQIRYTLTVEVAPSVNTFFHVVHTNYDGIGTYNNGLFILAGELTGYFDVYYERQINSFNTISYIGIIPSEYSKCVNNLTFLIPQLPTCGHYILSYFYEQNDEPYAIFDVVFTNDYDYRYTINIGESIIINNVKTITRVSNSGDIELIGDCSSMVYLQVIGDGNGTQTGDGYYITDSVANFTATPNSGYTFARWETCDTQALISNNSNESTVMNTNKCVKAIYYTGNVEIFFNNLFDLVGTDHIVNMKNDQEYIYPNKINYPIIVGHPEYKDIESAIDTDFCVRGISDGISSAFYNDNAPVQLTRHHIDAVIGVSGATDNAYSYKIKVSTFLGDENTIYEEYIYTYDNNNVNYSMLTKGSMSIAGSVLSENPWVEKLGKGFTDLLGKIFTKNIKSSADLPWYEPIKHTQSYAKGLGGAAGSSEFSTLVASAMEIAAVVYLLVIVADFIFEKIEDNNHDLNIGAVNGMFRYYWLTNGLYNNDSIKESRVKTIIDNITNYYGNVDTSSLTDVLNFNYIDVLDYITQSNKIGAYADGDQYIVSTNSIGFEFEPRGDQYDVSVPPPLIQYKIELVPIYGCTLSNIKPVVFDYLVAPDKYAQPKYDIVPKNNTNFGDETTWYYSSYATFKDAKYCDYIIINDTQKNNSRSGLLDFLGLFQSYHNFYIGTFGNDRHMSQNKVTNLTAIEAGNKYDKIKDKNFSINIGDLFSWKVGENTDVIHETGTYDVVFCMEKNKQLVMNDMFIDRHNVGDPYSDYIKKYWYLGTGWSINNGALRKTSGIESETYQSLNFSVACKHRVVLDIVVESGSGFYINCENIFFPSVYYTPDLNIDTVPLPDGVTIVGNKINITKTMRFNYFIRTNSLTDKKIKLGAYSDTNGYIKECTVQALPAKQAGSTAERTIVPLKVFSINADDYRASFSMYLIFRCPYYILNGTFPDLLNPSETITYDNELHYSDPYFTNPNISFIADVKDNYAYGEATPTLTVDFGDANINNYSLNYINLDKKFNISHNYIPILENKYSEYVVKITLKGVSQLTAFTCHSQGLIGIYDPNAMLYNADLDLSNTSIGYPSDMFYQLVKAQGTISLSMGSIM